MLLDSHSRRSESVSMPSIGVTTLPTGDDNFYRESTADTTLPSAAMIIASQQQQIEALRNEVKQLKAVIAKMQSNGHFESPSCHDLSSPAPPLPSVKTSPPINNATDSTRRSVKTTPPQDPMETDHHTINESILSNKSSGTLRGAALRPPQESGGRSSNNVSFIAEDVSVLSIGKQ